jgi:tetratricopeptide (TPR) repeat protein
LVEQVFHPRVLGVLGAYVVASVAAVAGMKWVTGKYLLSAQLPWVVGVALLSLVPAVAVLAWRRTGSSGGAWRRVVGIALPVNALGAIALLFVLFGSSDLGAATIAVSVRNEMGDLINRDIPKSAYRRRVALFPLENRSGDPELDWVQHGVPVATSVDLEQDPFVRTLSPEGFADRLEEAGKPDGLGLPVAQKRHIAAGLYMQYFTAGTIDREGGELVLTLELYDAKRASLVERREYRGGDLLDMVDEMSAQLRRDMGIPAGALEAAPDLPASELLTESSDAFRYFTEGYVALMARRLDDAAARFGAAVTEDESFALANLLRYVVLMQASRSDEAEPALAQAMEHSYRLNERMQLQVKLSYYLLVQQDAEKAMAVATMWTELYPEDPEGHMRRAELLQLRSDLVGVIDELQQVIALDSTQYNLLRTIGLIYSARGVFDTARTYLEAYAERESSDPEAFLSLANVALLQADYDGARDLYDRAMLLDAQNALALKGLGDVATGEGDPAAAARHYADAIAAARTVGQRSAVYEAMADLLILQGRVDEALGYLRQYWAAQDSIGGPMLGNQMRLQSIRAIAMGGKVDAALDSIRAIEGRLGESFSNLGAMGFLPVALEVDSVPLIVEGIERTETLIANFALEALRPIVLRARARVAELEGRCTEALPLYRQGRDLLPIAAGFDLDIARCMATEGESTAAVEMLREFVGRRPAVPRAYYELAAALHRAGRDAEARTELDRALAFWAGADPGFIPLRKAQALAAQLQ